MTVYIVALEPISTRYTKHWYDYLPDQIKNSGIDDVVQIAGEELSSEVSEGAFLNFSSTIYWKHSQLKIIAEMFHTGKIKDGDYFLFTDSWNSSAHDVRYMADLLGLKVHIGGIWHAGSYDKWDFLGRCFKDKEWSYSLERSLYNLFDDNYFATEFHIELFHTILGISDRSKSVRTGLPMEYFGDMVYDNPKKEDIVVFPHRISEEKHTELFKELAKQMPQYKFIIAMEECTTKDSYYKLLSKSKIVFSANLQETLGIGCVEGMMFGAIPVVPDRLSYREMYPDYLKYQSKYSESLDLTKCDIDALIDVIDNTMNRYDEIATSMNVDAGHIFDTFFTGTNMYKQINKRTA